MRRYFSSPISRAVFHHFWTRSFSGVRPSWRSSQSSFSASAMRLANRSLASSPAHWASKTTRPRRAALRRGRRDDRYTKPFRDVSSTLRRCSLRWVRCRGEFSSMQREVLRRGPRVLAGNIAPPGRGRDSAGMWCSIQKSGLRLSLFPPGRFSTGHRFLMARICRDRGRPKSRLARSASQGSGRSQARRGACLCRCPGLLAIPPESARGAHPVVAAGG